MRPLLEKQQWKILGPDGKLTDHTGAEIEPLQQAAWLLLTAEASEDPSYCRAYEDLVRDPSRLARLFLEDDTDWTNRYFDYFAFNLNFLAYYNLIQLEPQPARRRAYRESFEKHVYRQVKGTGNSFFDYIALAVGARTPMGTLASAESSLEKFEPRTPRTWSCILPPPSRLNRFSIDLYELNRAVEPTSIKFFPLAERPYPFASWCREDFSWQQSPYEICCCPMPEAERWTPYQKACASLTPQAAEGQTLVFPGVDYLVAYWMGRYHGFLKPES